MTNEETMTNDFAKIVLVQLNTDEQLNVREHEAIRVAIKALEQEPCEDAVSRQAVFENIKGLKKSPWFNDDIPGVRIVRKEAVEIIEDLCIKNLPSVNPAKKQELCEDAVSRQAVLDIFANNADAVRPYSKTWEEVKALPSVNPQPKWIPVSERLPEDYELVLFSTKTDRVFEGRYFDDNTDRQWYSFRDETFAWNNVVTAWMPLPQPYKPQESEG